MNQNSSEKKEWHQSILGPLSFLITFILWMSCMWSGIDSLGGLFGTAVLAAFYSLFSFWIVAIGLLLLSIPLQSLIYVLRSICRKD